MEQYSIITAIVLFGWLPVVLGIFYYLTPRRAVIVAFVVAWLFLPMAMFKLKGIPAYDKMSATCLGVLLAACIFDSRRMLNLSFFPSYVDIPMILWCLCPLATVASTSNDIDLTMKDGVSWMFEQVVCWGLPYLIGRIYCADRRSMRDLVVAIFVGGLIYVPLCLWEIRMSPQLHYMVYGFHQHSVSQQERGNTFRPMVFMQHGLAVGMFMISACVCGWMLWETGSLKKLRGHSVGWLLIPLIGTTILCKSWGATFLMLLGVAVLWLCRRTHASFLLVVLILAPTLYCATRIVLNWNGEGVPELIQTVADKERQHSLMFRLENEKFINQRTEQHDFWFGWGGYFRAFWLDTPDGKQVFTPDSLWISTFGMWGTLGLGALLLMTYPVLLLISRLPRDKWTDPSWIGVLTFCALLGLFQIDNMVNSMPNPLFLLGLGGLCSMARGEQAPAVASLETNYFVKAAKHRAAVASHSV